MNDDLISRAGAIDAVATALKGTFVEYEDIAEKIINKVPSAQLEERTKERTETHACDLISRAAAIDAAVEAADEWDGGYSRSREEIITLKLRMLPSAQPEPVRINLNEPIKVKLTELGKEIYYHQYDRANKIAGREICKPKFPKEDENGYTEFQLWCFMKLYGEHMGMIMPNVIEPLEIVYER